MPRLMSVAMTADAVIERRKTDGLTLDRLREVLTYNPQTGRFRWTGAPTRTGRDRSRQAGREAGVVAPNGYVKICIDGVKYQAHRLAWLYAHGSWPDAEVDHINGDPGDNRLANLRDAGRSENAQNLRRAHADNSSGMLGVSRVNDSRFVANISRDGRKVHLGSFRTAEDAHRAYLRAKAELHPFGGLPCPD